MSNSKLIIDFVDIPLSQSEKARVFRNTYLLISLSLIPVIFGAWSSSEVINYDFITGTFMLLYLLISSLFCIYLIDRSKNILLGFYILLSFTYSLGFLMSWLCVTVIVLSHGSKVIMITFAGAAGVFLLMAILSNLFKRFIVYLNNWIFICGLAIGIGSLINLCYETTTGVILISDALILILSNLLLYYLKQIVNEGEASHIKAVIKIYLYILYSSISMNGKKYSRKFR